MADFRTAIPGDPLPTFMVCPQTLGDWYVCAVEVAPDTCCIAEIAPGSSWKQTHPRAEAKEELAATEVTLAGEGSITLVRRNIQTMIGGNYQGPK